MPFLDRLLMKNPVRIWLSRIGFLNAVAPVAAFAKKRMDERQSRPEKDLANINARDFLSRFLEAGKKDPEFMHPGRVLSLTSANVFAGSDTTAISLRAIFYFLLKNESAMRALREELAEAEKKGHFSGMGKLVTWSEAKDLPYLTAVIKEALRLHPAVGLMLERVVPEGGVTLNGTYLPPKTVVGCNAWVIHHNRQVFGRDVEVFRPERWLENPEKASLMNQCLFSFGAGVRTCIGKNISYLEMYKLVPAMLRTFEVRRNTSPAWIIVC
jgi:cytochrome P450